MAIPRRLDRNAELLAPSLERSGSSLVPIQPRGSRHPLFCFHGGMGTVSFYAELARELGPDQPVYALQAQGRFGGAPPHAEVDEMIAHYVREIRSVDPRGPYYLTGFCFGGLLAVAVAGRLRSEGSEIALVSSFDGGSHRFDYAVQTGRADEPEASGASRARNWLARHWTALRGRGRRERIAYLRAKTGTRLRIWRALVRGKAALVAGDFFRRVGRPLPRLLRGSYFARMSERASRRYSPSPYPGDLVVFTSRGWFRDRHLGWDGWVTGRLDVREVDVARRRGDTELDEYHLSFIHGVAESFRETLRAAQLSARSEAAPPPSLEETAAPAKPRASSRRPRLGSPAERRPSPRHPAR